MLSGNVLVEEPGYDVLAFDLVSRTIIVFMNFQKALTKLFLLHKFNYFSLLEQYSRIIHIFK